MTRFSSPNRPSISLFFRRDKIVKLPCKLSARQVYILPTGQGMLFLFILFVMLLGSMNYNNNLGFIFTFLLGSMAIISILHTHKNLSGSILISVSAKPVFAKETAFFKVTLRPAKSYQPCICLNFSGEEKVIADLKGTRDRTIELPLKTKRRGLFRPPPLIISTLYPLGLFKAWVKLEADTDLLVYPEALPGSFTASPDFSGRNNDGEVEITGVDDFKELKTYTPGDPVNRISWKASSKGRGLYTKEFSGQTGASVIFNWEKIKGDDHEHKISRICDMILKAHNMNLSYGLQLPGRQIDAKEAKDPLHRHACLKELAMFQKGNSTGL